MNKFRLDQQILKLGLTDSRSQAENYIKLGYVSVNGKVVKKSGYFVSETAKIKLNKSDRYVSRAGLKLEAANQKFGIDFKNKLILDAGSSTGGFSDYALQKGAKKVIAVEVGSGQLHPSLRGNPKIELHEKTDIRDFKPAQKPDIILADLSFISLRKVLPHFAQIAGFNTQLIVLLKPQFEAQKDQINRGVIKNNKIRRQIIKEFENWIKIVFKIVKKTNSEVAGEKGNIERFYLLTKNKTND